MDEVFICGPEAMIADDREDLLAAGVTADRIHTERFTSAALEALKPGKRPKPSCATRPSATAARCRS